MQAQAALARQQLEYICRLPTAGELLLRARNDRGTTAKLFKLRHRLKVSKVPGTEVARLHLLGTLHRIRGDSSYDKLW